MATELAVDMCARALREHPHLAPFLRRDVLEAAQAAEREGIVPGKQHEKEKTKVSAGKEIKRMDGSPLKRGREKSSDKKTKRGSSKEKPDLAEMIMIGAEETKERTQSQLLAHDDGKENMHEAKDLKEEAGKRLSRRSRKSKIHDKPIDKIDRQKEDKSNVANKAKAIGTFKNKFLKKEKSFTNKVPPFGTLKREKSDVAKSTKSEMNASAFKADSRRAWSSTSLKSVPTLRKSGSYQTTFWGSKTRSEMLAGRCESQTVGLSGKQRKSKSDKFKSKTKARNSAPSKKECDKPIVLDDDTDTLTWSCEQPSSGIPVAQELRYDFLINRQSADNKEVQENSISIEENIEVSSTSPKNSKSPALDKKLSDSFVEEDETKDAVSTSISGYIRKLVFGEPQAQQEEREIFGEVQASSPRTYFMMPNSPMTTIEEAPLGSCASDDTQKCANDLENVPCSTLSVLKSETLADEEMKSYSEAAGCTSTAEQMPADFSSCVEDGTGVLTPLSKKRSPGKPKVSENANAIDMEEIVDTPALKVREKSNARLRGKALGGTKSASGPASGLRKAQKLNVSSHPLSPTRVRSKSSHPSKSPEIKDTLAPPNTPLSSKGKTIAKPFSKKNQLSRNLSAGSITTTRYTDREKSFNANGSKNSAARSASHTQKHKRSESENVKSLGTKQKFSVNSKAEVDGDSSTIIEKTSDPIKTNPAPVKGGNKTTKKRSKSQHQYSPKSFDQESPKFATLTIPHRKKAKILEQVAQNSKKIKEKQKCRQKASKMLDNYNIEVKREEVLGAVVSLVTYHPKKAQDLNPKNPKGTNLLGADQSKNCRYETMASRGKDNSPTGVSGCQDIKSDQGSIKTDFSGSSDSLLQSLKCNASLGNALPCPSIECDTDSESELTYTSKYGRYSLRLHDLDDAKKRVDKTFIDDQGSTSKAKPFSLRPSALDGVVKVLESQTQRTQCEELIPSPGYFKDQKPPLSPRSGKPSKILTASPSISPAAKPIDSITLDLEMAVSGTLQKELSSQAGGDEQSSNTNKPRRSPGKTHQDYKSAHKEATYDPVVISQFELELQSDPKASKDCVSGFNNKGIDKRKPKKAAQRNLDSDELGADLKIQTSSPPLSKHKKSNSASMNNKKYKLSPPKPNAQNLYSLQDKLNTTKKLHESKNDAEIWETNISKEGDDDQSHSQCHQVMASKCSPSLCNHDTGRRIGGIAQQSEQKLLKVKREKTQEKRTKSKGNEKSAYADKKRNLSYTNSKISEGFGEKREMPQLKPMLTNQKISSPTKNVARASKADTKDKSDGEILHSRQGICAIDKQNARRKLMGGTNNLPSQQMHKQGDHTQEKHAHRSGFSPNKEQSRNHVKKPVTKQESQAQTRTSTNPSSPESARKSPIRHQRLSINRTSPARLHELDRSNAQAVTEALPEVVSQGRGFENKSLAREEDRDTAKVSCAFSLDPSHPLSMKRLVKPCEDQIGEKSSTAVNGKNIRKLTGLPSPEKCIRPIENLDKDKNNLFTFQKLKVPKKNSLAFRQPSSGNTNSPDAKGAVQVDNLDQVTLHQSSVTMENSPHVFGSNAAFSLSSFQAACSQASGQDDPDLNFGKIQTAGDHFRTYRQRTQSDDEDE